MTTFNAANLRKLTDASRTPKQVEYARKMFKELELRAWANASLGKNTAGLPVGFTRQLDDKALATLREMAEGAGLQFFNPASANSGIWVKW